MYQARIKSYSKDESTKELILLAYLIDEHGKPLDPLAMSSDGSGEIRETEVSVRLSLEGLQKLIREELPTEEKRIQEILDKIHEIRLKCALNLEAINTEVEAIKDGADAAFNACQNKNDVFKVRGLYLTKIGLITQKRHLSRLAIQEESELSLQLAKLRQGTQSD
jgi:hypothetical protein